MLFLKFINSINSDTDFEILEMTEKLSIREKVGFSLSDSAANFIFQTIMLLQLSFYTDSFGISVAAAGLLFLVVREKRTRGTHHALTPVIDVCREPRWGRVVRDLRRRSVSEWCS